MILAGDIGGTKTNIALFEQKGSKLEVIQKKQFASAEYKNFIDILDLFLNDIGDAGIESACFGIAGPVINGICRTTNLPWDEVVINDLREKLNIKSVELLNDLAATSYGMLYLEDKELVSLNPKGEKCNGTCAVIAVGTGLGEGILYYDGKEYHPMATEGGHTDFAPLDRLEDELLEWLRKKYPDHVSYERVLCGEGLYTIYEFLKHRSAMEESIHMKAISKHMNKGAMVSYFAMEEKDPLSMDALELFCKIYGSEAGNLALKSLSTGGVYIGGGIAPQIISVLQDGVFMKSFLSKGRFKGLLEKMEVKVSLNPETALIGAAYYARNKLKG